MTDFLISIFSFAVGSFAIYMFFRTTKKRFLNEKTYDGIRYITPLPPSFNFWIIKMLFVVGGLLCLAVGVYGTVKPFL